MNDAIYKIVTPQGEVVEKTYIAEFVSNVDKEIFETIQNHLKKLKEHNDIKPLQFTSTPEQVALGAPETYTVPVTFNNSDFFAQGF